MIKRLLFLFSIAVAATLFLRTFVFDTIYVASGSMEPTLEVGTHYLVNLWVYRLSAPERGDIIVFTDPVEGKKGFIKRVIGVAGDVVQLKDKAVYLNGKLLEEPFAIHKRAKERLVGDNIGPLKVPDGHVFVLGDDRDESYDSTTWKDPATGAPMYFLPVKNIKGRLVQFS